MRLIRDMGSARKPPAVQAVCRGLVWTRQFSWKRKVAMLRRATLMVFESGTTPGPDSLRPEDLLLMDAGEEVSR